jgi:hypothetical protein
MDFFEKKTKLISFTCFIDLYAGNETSLDGLMAPSFEVCPKYKGPPQCIWREDFSGRGSLAGPAGPFQEPEEAGDDSRSMI